MKFTLSLSLVLLLNLSTAAFAQKPDLSSAPDPTVSAAERELLIADTQFNDDVQKGGVEAWTRWFAEDGIEASGAAPAVGHAAITKLMAGDFAQKEFSLTWKADGARALESGRMGVTWGHWKEHFMTPDGKSVDLTGQYITVFKKQKDGAWKVIWDGGEPAPPKQ